MSTVAMSGDDVVILNDRIFQDLADDTFAELVFPNKAVKVKVGKNGNAIYGLDETGKLANFKIRVIRGSSDDQFLNALLATQQRSISSFVLIKGEFIKKIGDGNGVVKNDKYLVSGGVIEKVPDAKGNASGESDQSVVIYELVFSNAPRVIT